jgi:uncharacterized protein (TIGR03067 family)
MQTTLMLGLALAVGAPALKEPKKDPPSLVGEWVPELAVVGGQAMPLPMGSLVTFSRDGKCKLTDGTAAAIDLTYIVDPKKNPAEIDVSDVGARAGAKELMGIYRFDGDKLLICITLVGDRPKTFESLGGSQTILLTLKRFKRD